MSKVIKGNTLHLTAPMVVEASSVEEAHEFTKVHVEKEQRQLHDLQRESKQLIQETETMMVDLLEKAREEARTIIAQALEEAELLQMQAAQASQQMQAEAQENGYQTGLKKAQKEMEAQKVVAKQEREALLEAARAQKLQMLSGCEADILRLSMAIARKIVAGELLHQPEVILDVIRQAIALLDNPENVTIYVNPAELEKVLPELEGGLYGKSDKILIKADVLPDNHINSGGCVLQSEIGMIDARIETRWDNMEKTLQEVSGHD